MKKDSSENKKLFLEISKIFNEIDPECLEPGKKNGAPPGEYDQEVGKLINFILHHQEEIKVNTSLLIDEINKIWRENFNTDCNMSDELAVALLKVIF